MNNLTTNSTQATRVWRWLACASTAISNLLRVSDRKMENNGNLISNTVILRSYLGLLCLGKSDCEAITAMRKDDYFKNSLGITNVPSAVRLRQRFDEEAENYLPVAQKCSMAMLKNGKALFTALDTGHIPLDADVFPMDNSATKKEKVSRTYKGHDGYAPIAAYLGMEGWCLEVELRPGSQHSQEGFIPFMKRVLDRARTLTRLKLRFGCHCPAYPAFIGVYGRLLAGT